MNWSGRRESNPHDQLGRLVTEFRSDGWQPPWRCNRSACGRGTVPVFGLEDPDMGRWLYQIVLREAKHHPQLRAASPGTA